MIKRVYWMILLLLFMPVLSQAAVPEWEIIQSESNILFTGIQNDAPITGSFKKFTGTIQFDPNQLNASKVRLVIDMNSVSTSYKEFTSTLVTEDWFAVKLFPQAVFVAKQFKKTGENAYQADGTLTIRNKTLPIQVSFIGEALENSKAQVQGSATLKRNAFGIGRGEWTSTDAVKDEVKVNFTLVAKKK